MNILDRKKSTADMSEVRVRSVPMRNRWDTVGAHRDKRGNGRG